MKDCHVNTRTPRSPLGALFTEKALAFVSSSRNDALLEAAISEEAIPVKNVCARVSPDLSDRIDGICDLLRISKRLFIETALIEACDRADLIMSREGVWEILEPSTNQGAASC